MKLSKVVALSSLLTAICSVLLVLGALVPTLSYSCIFLASIVILVPLSKDTYKGAILTVIASGLLSFLIASFSFETALPFLLFFGFHPIVSKFFKSKNLNKFLAILIKDVWFVGAMLVCYFLTDLFITDNEIYQKYMIYIVTIGGAVLFIAYDFLFDYFQRAVTLIMARLKF